MLKDIAEHAKAWVAAHAKLLNNMTRQELLDAHELVEEFGANLDRPPDTLEDLKFVLNMVAEIGSRSMEMELHHTLLEEKYRTLRMYGYLVSDDEAEIVDNISSGGSTSAAKRSGATTL